MWLARKKRELRFVGRLIFLLSSMLLWLRLDGASLYAQSCDGALTLLQSAISQCSELNENWACYGNIKTIAAPEEIRFYEPRDRQPVSTLHTINTSADGAALMYLHFQGDNAPIRMIVFGDTLLDQAGEGKFALAVESEQPICQSSPPGLVVQTKDGETGTIEVNRVEIDLRSTAFITVLDGEAMIVVNLGGQVSITIPGLGGPIALLVGQQVDITLSNGAPIAIGQVITSPYAESVLLRWLTDSPQGLRRVTDPNTEPHPVIPACGGLITFGQAISAANFTPGQECLYRFCANRGDVITVDMDGISGTLNPWIDVRRPDDQLLVFNNDRDNNDFNSQICNAGMPETSCDYTIVARPNHNASLGNFTLSLNRLTTCTPSPMQCEPVIPTGLGFVDKSAQALVTQQALPPLSICTDSPPLPNQEPEVRSCLVRGPNDEPRCDRDVVDDSTDSETLVTSPPKASPFSGP